MELPVNSPANLPANLPEYPLIAPNKRVAGTGWASNIVAIGFIALMATMTSPLPEAPSAYDQPLPMPAGIEDDPAAWIKPAG